MLFTDKTTRRASATLITIIAAKRILIMTTGNIPAVILVSAKSIENKA